jgi:hypothetical protein
VPFCYIPAYSSHRGGSSGDYCAEKIDGAADDMVLHLRRERLPMNVADEHGHPLIAFKHAVLS